jgi:hypothetical protein
MDEDMKTDTPAAPAYKDDDLVYVDPEARTVVGLVEWNVSGRPKSLLMKMPGEDAPEAAPAAPAAEAKDGKPPIKGKDRRPPRRQRFYPWGTYRSMKRIYKIEGKIHKEESNKTLDEVIEKALKEPFWD